MTHHTKGGMSQSTQTSTQTEQRKVCFNTEDGAWYSTGAVICKNGHDWECKPNGKFAARGNSSSSCTM